MLHLILPDVWKYSNVVIQFAILFLGLFSSSRLYKRYNERKTITGLLALLLILFFGISPISLVFDAFFWKNGYEIQWGYAIMLLLSGIANITMILFATDVFFSKTGTVPMRFRIYNIVFIVLELIFTIAGFISKINQSPITTFIAIHMFIALSMYVLVAIKAFQTAKLVEEALYRKSIMVIGIFNLLLVGIYIFFIIDSFYTVYTIWSTLGWILYLGCTYLFYLGFIKPINVSK